MRIHSLTPYAHVADIHRSIAFYARLGLEVQNRHFDGEVLAWGACEGGVVDDGAGADEPLEGVLPVEVGERGAEGVAAGAGVVEWLAEVEAAPQ